MSNEADKSREYLESQQDEQAPLTKPKKTKSKAVIIEAKIEAPDPEIIPAKVKKPRAPKTQKQLEVFREKCALARQNNIKKKDDVLESAKQIVKKEIKKTTKQNNVVESDSSDSSDSEPEVIHVRRKSKRKPKKKIVVVHSDSSSDSEPQYEMKKEFGKSHRNKKSVPSHQVETKPVASNVRNPINFFAD
jgi:hypothetical protein